MEVDRRREEKISGSQARKNSKAAEGQERPDWVKGDGLILGSPDFIVWSGDNGGPSTEIDIEYKVPL